MTRERTRAIVNSDKVKKKREARKKAGWVTNPRYGFRVVGARGASAPSRTQRGARSWPRSSPGTTRRN
jgi:hypothetical protein